MGSGRISNKVINSKIPIKINNKIQLDKIEKTAEGYYKCSCCGTVYNTQKTNFPATSSILYKGNNGYLTFCRKCVENYFNQLTEAFCGNDEHALEHCCRVFDWYYSVDASALTKASAATTSRVLMYPAKMNIQQIRCRGNTYLDTIKNKCAEKIMHKEDLKTEDEDETKVNEETVMFFGYGYSKEEYEYLENQYADWTTRYECKTKAQEELFKNLCVAQLMQQRAQKNGTIKDVTDSMKAFQDLLSAANIKPSQDNSSTFADQNTFGTLIKRIENEKPISEPLEEWKDVDGINKYIDTWFLGHLCNLVHVKNDHEESYRREIEKTTVKPPVYEEDDDFGESSLLDKYSDKAEKTDSE